jgi:hypothetical protein
MEQQKPFSAISVTVERLTGESYDEEDLSGIPDLVEVIMLQATGAFSTSGSLVIHDSQLTPERRSRGSSPSNPQKAQVW